MVEEKSVFQKIGDAVVDFAPSIAGVLALTGVGAPIAGALGAVAALGRSFGLGSEAKPEEVLAAISNDPEIRLKAMVADNDFKVKMRDLDIQEMKENTQRLKDELTDIQGARLRDMAIRSAGQKNIRADILLLVAFVTVAVLYTVAAYFGASLSDIIIGSILTTVGTFVQKIGTVFDFEFGSSRGSEKKTEDAAAMARELVKSAAGK
jgi:hypothetical protein